MMARYPKRLTSSISFALGLVLVACGDDAPDPGDAGTDLGFVDAGPGTDGGDASVPNRPPTATPIAIDAQIDTPFEGQLEGADPDADALTFTITADPANGSLTLDDTTSGAFTYTPDAGHVGDDEFTFEVSDGSETADAVVSITVHYLTDGTLDDTFAGDGVQMGPVNGSSLSDLVFLGDGRVVAVGNAMSADLLLVAYEADGTFDTSFGSSGSVVADVAGGYDGWDDVTLQSDGRMITAGQSGDSSRDFLLGAYSDEGVRDATFGTDGYARLDFGGGSDAGTALLVLDDDALLVGGYAESADGDEDFAVAKVDADGELDTAFGTDGWSLVDFEGADDRVRAMALDAMGRIVVSGEAEVSDESGEYVGVARLGADGELDTTFGTDGRTAVMPPGMSGADAVAIDDRGAIWIGGTAYDGTDGSMIVIALDGDGDLDTTFDDDGWAMAGFPADGAGANAMILRPGGGFLLGGSAGSEAAVAALLPDGSLDARYDDDGLATYTLGAGGSDIFFGMRRGPEGRVVAVGWSREGTLRPVAVRLAR